MDAWRMMVMVPVEDGKVRGSDLLWTGKVAR